MSSSGSSPGGRPTWLVPVTIIAAVFGLLLVSLLDRGGDAEITVPDEITFTTMASPPTTAGLVDTVAPGTSLGAAAPTAAPAKELAASDATATTEEWPARRIPDDEYAIGDLDAPVVLIEYADFQCGYCARWHDETLPALQERYIDTGLVRFEWRDLPFLGQESFTGAYAARAAGRQEMFWEFNDAIYGDRAGLTEGALKQLAVELGLDDAQFDADFEDLNLRNEVHANLGEATMIGFNSTPSFVVNKRAIVGAQPFEVFEEVLNEALTAAGVTPPPTVPSDDPSVASTSMPSSSEPPTTATNP